MTTVELLQILSYVSFGLAGVFLVISVALFFGLGVIKVVGDLSGATARKAIEQIRQQNEESGEKVHKTSAVNKKRGRVTDKITPSGRLRQTTGPLGATMGTQKFAARDLMPTQDTTVLDGAGETSVLESPAYGETSVLESPAYGETSVLESPAYGETSVLTAPVYDGASSPVDFGQTTVLGSPVHVSDPMQFYISAEIEFIGSTEIIR